MPGKPLIGVAWRVGVVTGGLFFKNSVKNSRSGNLVDERVGKKKKTQDLGTLMMGGLERKRN